MEDLTIMLKTILSQNGGWMVLITLIISLMFIIITLIKGAKSLGERVSDSVDNSVNKKSEVRIKELEVRREELKIQNIMAAAHAESTSTINDLAKTKTCTKGVKAVKLTQSNKEQSRNKSLNSDINKTRKATHVLPKHQGGFSR